MVTEMRSELGALLPKKSEWLELLEDHGVPARLHEVAEGRPRRPRRPPVRARAEASASRRSPLNRLEKGSHRGQRRSWPHTCTCAAVP